MIEKWTPEKLRKLQSLVKENLTAREIASILRVSRNSVIGKLNREGLKLNGATGPRPKSRKPKEKPIRSVPPLNYKRDYVAAHGRRDVMPLPKQEKFVYTGESISFLQLSYNTCKYSVSGDTYETFRFCGKTIHDRSFCIDHFKLCYTRKPDVIAA